MGLKLNGRLAFTRYFANPLRKQFRTIYQPNMSGEEAIAIPCFVKNCHWVSVVWREVGRQVFFCYSDDFNCTEMEHDIHTLISQGTCPKFYPSHAKWINCKSYKYSPHSNECSPRKLLATLIMLNLPNPHENILLPYMHPNLAQFARIWVAQTILTGEPSFPSLVSTKHQKLINPYKQIKSTLKPSISPKGISNQRREISS